MTPTLVTRRLALAPLTKPTPRQVKWLRDPKVVEFSEQRHHQHTMTTQERYIKSLPAGSHIWAIHTVLTDEHIGNLAAIADMPNQLADLGILIGERDFWNCGYATEAWNAATEWLLDPEQGKFRKIEAGCMALNAAMRRVLFQAGFAFEGERKNHFLWNGQLVGQVYYGRFR